MVQQCGCDEPEGEVEDALLCPDGGVEGGPQERGVREDLNLELEGVGLDDQLRARPGSVESGRGLRLARVGVSAAEHGTNQVAAAAVGTEGGGRTRQK